MHWAKVSNVSYVTDITDVMLHQAIIYGCSPPYVT